MIREAELFLLADETLTGVIGQIRAEHWDTVLPPVFDMPGADQPTPLRAMVNHLAYDEAWIPAMLAGATMDEIGRDRFDGDLLGWDQPDGDPHAAVTRIAEAARTAARTVTDRDTVVHCGYGDVPTWDYFWQLNIARTLSATDLAAHLGIRDPLTDELSRGMWEGTAPAADMWRQYGIYREPVPVADDAPWRERYLGLTGRHARADSRP